MGSFSEEREKLMALVPEEKISKVMRNDFIKADLHTHLINVNLEEGIRAAVNNDLDEAAFGSFNYDNFSDTQKEAERLRFKGFDPEIFSNYIIMFKRSKRPFTIIKMVEYGTAENLHVNILGNTDGIKPGMSIFEVLDKAVKKSLPTLDHIGVDSRNPYMPIHKKTEELIHKICEEYHDRIAIELNGYCIPKVWANLREFYKTLDKSELFMAFNKISNLESFKDLNERILDKNPNDFAKELALKYEIPCYASTDLHARNKKLANDIGAAYVRLECNGFDDPVDSLIHNLQNNQYSNHEGYVSVSHVLEAFGQHVILSKFGINNHRVRG